MTAYWDGLRHLEFNRNHGCDMNGYLYYQSMPDLISMLQKAREIEVECCRRAFGMRISILEDDPDYNEDGVRYGITVDGVNIHLIPKYSDLLITTVDEERKVVTGFYADDQEREVILRNLNVKLIAPDTKKAT